MRRRDFFFGRPRELPTLEFVAKQISHHLHKLGLSVVFLSTDASSTGMKSIHMLYLLKHSFDS